MTKKIIITDPTAQIDAWLLQTKERLELNQKYGDSIAGTYNAGELGVLNKVRELLEDSTHGEYNESLTCALGASLADALSVIELNTLGEGRYHLPLPNDFYEGLITKSGYEDDVE